MSGGESIIIKQHLMIRKFRKAEAFDASRAKTLAELKIRSNWIFRRMADRGVFVEAGDGRYYIDQEEARTFQSHQRRGIFFAVVIIGTIALALYFLGVLKPK